jgi:hypothetical protein
MQLKQVETDFWQVSLFAHLFLHSLSLLQDNPIFGVKDESKKKFRVAAASSLENVVVI